MDTEDEIDAMTEQHGGFLSFSYSASKNTDDYNPMKI